MIQTISVPFQHRSTAVGEMHTANELYSDTVLKLQQQTMDVFERGSERKAVCHRHRCDDVADVDA